MEMNEMNLHLRILQHPIRFEIQEEFLSIVDMDV